VLRRSKTTVVKKNAAAAAALAAQLAADKKFRKQLLRAAGHAATAQRRARRGFGLLAPLRRLAADQQLRSDLRQMVQELDAAWARVEKKRSHRLRNSLLAAAGASATAAAALPQSRQALRDRVDKLRGACEEPPAGGASGAP
jgi:hypothetical protein